MKNLSAIATAAGLFGMDYGTTPGFIIGRKRKQADPKKKAKRKAARQARKRNRR